jgi:hypothetical protein
LHAHIFVTLPSSANVSRKFSNIVEKAIRFYRIALNLKNVQKG